MWILSLRLFRRLQNEFWDLAPQQPRAFEDFGDSARKSDFFATRAPRAERTLKEVAKGCVQAGVRSLSSLISPEHEWALLVAHRASCEAARPPRSCPGAPGRDLDNNMPTVLSILRFGHVRTSKCRRGDILRILRFGALNNGFLTIGVGYGPRRSFARARAA